jgi:hypothetical protein
MTGRFKHPISLVYSQHHRAGPIFTRPYSLEKKKGYFMSKETKLFFIIFLNAVEESGRVGILGK